MTPLARPVTAAAPAPRRDGSREPAAAASLVALLCAAVFAYLPALDGEFHFDDSTTILRDWAIRDPALVLRELSPGQLLGPDRPLTRLSFALDYARGGLDSGAPAEHELAALFRLGRTNEACLAWRRLSSAGWAGRIGPRVRAAALQCR